MHDQPRSTGRQAPLLLQASSCAANCWIWPTCLLTCYSSTSYALFICLPLPCAGEYIPVRCEPLDLAYIDGMLLLPLIIEHTIGGCSCLV